MMVAPIGLQSSVQNSVSADAARELNTETVPMVAEQAEPVAADNNESYVKTVAGDRMSAMMIAGAAVSGARLLTMEPDPMARKNPISMLRERAGEETVNRLEAMHAEITSRSNESETDDPVTNEHTSVVAGEKDADDESPVSRVSRAFDTLLSEASSVLVEVRESTLNLIDGLQPMAQTTSMVEQSAVGQSLSVSA